MRSGIFSRAHKLWTRFQYWYVHQDPIRVELFVRLFIGLLIGITAYRHPGWITLFLWTLKLVRLAWFVYTNRKVLLQ